MCTECTKPTQLDMEGDVCVASSTEAPESGGCVCRDTCDFLGEEEHPSRRLVSGLCCDFSRTILCPFQGAATQETVMQLRLGDSISDTWNTVEFPKVCATLKLRPYERVLTSSWVSVVTGGHSTKCTVPH